MSSVNFEGLLNSQKSISSRSMRINLTLVLVHQPTRRMSSCVLKKWRKIIPEWDVDYTLYWCCCMQRLVSWYSNCNFASKTLVRTFLGCTVSGSEKKKYVWFFKYPRGKSLKGAFFKSLHSLLMPKFRNISVTSRCASLFLMYF